MTALFYIDTSNESFVIVSERKTDMPIAKFKKSPDEHNLISVYQALLHTAVLSYKRSLKPNKRKYVKK